MDKTYAFIDWANLHGDFCEMNHRVDMNKLIDALVSMGADRIYLYSPEVSEQQGKFLDYVARIPRVTVKRSPLKEKRVNDNGIEKKFLIDQATDLNLACDMVYHVVKGNCSRCILVSRDADYCQAVDICKGEGAVVDLALMDEKKDTAGGLRMACDDCLVIRRKDIERVDERWGRR